MIPDFEIRKKVRESLRDKDGKINVFSYIFGIIATIIIVNLMLFLPSTLVGTKWEWVAVKINEENTWKTIYGVSFVIILFIIIVILGGIYEFIKDKLGF